MQPKSTRSRTIWRDTYFVDSKVDLFFISKFFTRQNSSSDAWAVSVCECVMRVRKSKFMHNRKHESHAMAIYGANQIQYSLCIHRKPIFSSNVYMCARLFNTCNAISISAGASQFRRYIHRTHWVRTTFTVCHTFQHSAALCLVLLMLDWSIYFIGRCWMAI